MFQTKTKAKKKKNGHLKEFSSGNQLRQNFNYSA